MDFIRDSQGGSGGRSERKVAPCGSSAEGFPRAGGQLGRRRSWLPPETHIGYPQSEVGDFFALGRLLEEVYAHIPVFEIEKYQYLEEVKKQLTDENPLQRLQSHEELQKLLEPTKIFRFYRHWNIEGLNSIPLQENYCKVGTIIIACNSEYLYRHGLLLPTSILQDGKMIGSCHTMLFCLFYLFEHEFQTSVDYLAYTQLIDSLPDEEKIFISWLHRVQRDKMELANFATILDSYANMSDMWAHLIDYFQRQWPEYRCMFVQFDTLKKSLIEIDFLCTLPVFHQLHHYQSSLQNCIDRSTHLDSFLDLSIYFLVFGSDSCKAQKLFKFKTHK